MDLRELLPNPPHKGLPTPKAWGQTWESFEKRDPIAEGVVVGTTVCGMIMGAAVGVGVGMAVGPPVVAIPIAFAVMGAGGTTGAAFGGLIMKTSERQD